jgi:hypothetical protein
MPRITYARQSEQEMSKSRYHGAWAVSEGTGRAAGEDDAGGNLPGSRSTREDDFVGRTAGVGATEAEALLEQVRKDYSRRPAFRREIEALMRADK